MNTELLRRILDKARDAAATPAEADEIRCLMLDVLPQNPRSFFFSSPLPARKSRKARK